MALGYLVLMILYGYITITRSVEAVAFLFLLDVVIFRFFSLISCFCCHDAMMLVIATGITRLDYPANDRKLMNKAQVWNEHFLAHPNSIILLTSY